MKISEADKKRFWEKVCVDSVSECWLWMSCVTKSGYGRFQVHPKTLRAHRVSYFIYYGVDPDALCVCHKCDNTRCCNPTHLWLGTTQQNSKDRDLKKRGSRGKKARISTNTAKLTADQVVAIRADTRMQKVIANYYGVSRTQISRIKTLKHWKEL